MAQLSFYHLQKLFLGNYSIETDSLGSHVDFPEYILVSVFYIFICNLQVTIKDRENYFSCLGKGLRDSGERIILKLNKDQRHVI